jgi:Carboxypeptidase regulatory-like domain
MLALLLLTLAAGEAAATVPLAPAPGSSPAASIALDGRAVVLDKDGRADISATTTLAAPGMRFYRLSDGGPAFYFPRNDTLVTWPLTGPDQPARAEIIVKAVDATTWEHAPAFEAPVEVEDGKASVRFVLSPGEWDVAILLPGFAPAFSTDVAARQPAVSVALSALKRAARVRARILSARTGKPPERWLAWVSRMDAGPEDEQARFFATRPIAVDRMALDFASIPVAAWELKAEIPGGGRKRHAFTAMKPGGVTNLGDFVIPDLGSVRLTLDFPVELPPGNITVRIKSLASRKDVELGSKTVPPKAHTVVEIGQIEPGLVSIESEAGNGAIRHVYTATVEPGEFAEDHFVFAPVRIHGAVKRGEDGVPDAEVSVPLDGTPRAISATSGPFGEYSLRVWAASSSVVMMTLPPGDETHFVEEVPIEPGASEVAHDVWLPTTDVHGIVRDRDTLAPIAGAIITVSPTAVPPDEPTGPNPVSISTPSDREGRFRVRNLVARPINVQIEHEGYAPLQFTDVEVTPEGKELDVRLEKGQRLHGIVTDETGTPLIGVGVGLDPDARGLEFARHVVTSGAGEFEFSGTATGLHILEVFECGYRIVVRPVDVAEREQVPGRNEANIQLVPEAAVLRVHVEDDAGTPLGNTALQWTVHGVMLPIGRWQDFAQSCGHAVVTDADGNLELHGVPGETIGAVVPPGGRLLGTVNNDGNENTWTIVIPKE